MQKQRQEPSVDRARPRVACGLRVSAAVEIAVFLTVVTALGLFLELPDRFTGVQPHPYWIVVILIASCYGTGEGLLAAALATGVLLVGNVPEQAFGETLAGWLLRVTTLPVSWFLTAAVLGEIRSGHMRAYDEAIERLHGLYAQAGRIAAAYEELAEAKSRLEQRVATQKQTLRAAYEASRPLDGPTVSDVLAGAPAFVKAMLRPRKFSLFVLAENRLNAVPRDAGMAQDGFDAASPLFDAIVHQRRHLFAADPADEAILQDGGVLAGPLIDEINGRVFGMLKVEEIDLSSLTPSSVLDFRTVCAWIGRACANASRLEERAPALGARAGAHAFALETGREARRPPAAALLDIPAHLEKASGTWKRMLAWHGQTTDERGATISAVDADLRHGDRLDYAILVTGGSAQLAQAIGRQLAGGPGDQAPLQDARIDGADPAVKVVPLRRGRRNKAGHVVN